MQENISVYFRGSKDAAPYDTELVHAVEVNSSTFGMLYRQYRDRIYWYLLARTGSEEDAADLTQTVFLRALEYHHQYCSQKGSFLVWLISIARNSCTNFLQRRRVTISWDYTPDIFSFTTEQDMEEEIIKQENLDRLRQLVKTLDAQKQELLVLRFVSGLTIAEIAILMKKSEGATKKQFSRMLHTLKEQYYVTTR